MTVPVQVPFTASTANGVTTSFPYSFKIASADDLVVEVDGVPVTTGFSVTGVGVTAGGNVLFVNPPGNGSKVVRYRKPQLKRINDFQQFGDWNANTVNGEFDALWLAMQAQAQNASRAIKLPVDTADDQVIPEDATERAVKGIGFDTLGKLMLYPIQTGTSLVDLMASAGASLIGFIQSGVGAVARTLQGKARDTVSVKDFGAVGDGVTDDSAKFTTASAAAVAAGARLYVPAGTYVIGADTTVGAGMVCDGILSVASTKTLTINGAFDCGVRQCFAGAGSVVFGPGAVDAIRPDWFATNTTPGTTDMAPAVSKAIATAFASRISTVKFAASRYYFDSVVTISEQYQDLRLTGSAMAGFINAGYFTNRITGKAGLEALFLFSPSGSPGMASAFSLEVDHLSFDGSNTTTGVGSAIKSTAEGAPARPLNIHHCQFVRFDKAIYSLEAAGGTNTGICQVNIIENTFYANNYSVYGAGDLNAIMNMRFVGNVSEQGGKIRFANNSAGGTLNISDNIMEGQADPVYVLAGLCHAEIERNYFEGCSGTIITFSSTNGASILKVGNNHYVNMVAGSKNAYGNCYLVHTDISSGINIQVNNLQSDSKLNMVGWVQDYLSTGSGDINCLSIDHAGNNSGLGTLGPYGISVSKNSVSASTTNTPYGTLNYYVAAMDPFAVAKAISTNDYVVVTFLAAIAQSSSGAKTRVYLYNAADALLANTAEMQVPADGAWHLMCAVLKTPSASASYRIRFASNPLGTVYISDFYSYPITSGNVQVYPFFPRQ